MDYINRKDALSFPFANGKYDKENANEHFIFGCETYREWLEQLPVKRLEDDNWITCDEKMPDEMEIVLVTHEYGVGVAYYNGHHWERFSVAEGPMMTIKAWMPLPKPYKEKK